MATIRPLYGRDMATKQQRNGHHTATGNDTATIRPLYSNRQRYGHHMDTKRPLYGHDTATIWPQYVHYTDTIRPQYVATIWLQRGFCSSRLANNGQLFYKSLKETSKVVISGLLTKH